MLPIMKGYSLARWSQDLCRHNSKLRHIELYRYYQKQYKYQDDCAMPCRRGMDRPSVGAAKSGPHLDIEIPSHAGC